MLYIISLSDRFSSRVTLSQAIKPTNPILTYHEHTHTHARTHACLGGGGWGRGNDRGRSDDQNLLPLLPFPNHHHHPRKKDSPLAAAVRHGGQEPRPQRNVLHQGGALAGVIAFSLKPDHLFFYFPNAIDNDRARVSSPVKRQT